MTELRLAIVGSRKYTDAEAFQKVVDIWIAKNGAPTVIISGGAAGVDTLAEAYAKANNIELLVFEADWSQGRGAGPARNTIIVAACTHVLAFPSRKGRGTQDTIKKAERADKTIEWNYCD